MSDPREWTTAQSRSWAVLGHRVRIDYVTECWEWTGALNTRGYGVLRHRGRLVLAHRLSLRSALGRSLRSGKLVLHACHNRKCCNPDHLSEGTPSRNQLDRWARRRVSTLQD